MTSFPLLAPHKWRPLGVAWAIAFLSSLALVAGVFLVVGAIGLVVSRSVLRCSDRCCS